MFHGNNTNSSCRPQDIPDVALGTYFGLHCSLFAAKNSSKLTGRLYLNKCPKGSLRLPLEQPSFSWRPHWSCLGVHMSSACTCSLGITTRVSFECISECTVRTMLSLIPSTPMRVYPQHLGLPKKCHSATWVLKLQILLTVKDYIDTLIYDITCLSGQFSLIVSFVGLPVTMKILCYWKHNFPHHYTSLLAGS